MGASVSTVSNASVSARGEIAVIVGGTQGIGRGIAVRFARAGAEIWLVVRNEQRGQAVVDELVKVAPSGTPRPRIFLADMNVKEEVFRCADEIKAAAGEAGVHYLIQNQGGPSNPKDIAPNADGFDAHFAVQVLSRVILAYELRHIVTRSSMAVAAAGVGSKHFDTQDITLEGVKARGEYNYVASGQRDCTMLDAAYIAIAKDAPNAAQYTHVFPGFVRTNTLSNSGILDSEIKAWLFWLAGLILGRSVEWYAEIPFYMTANPEGRKLVEREGEGGVGFWDEKFKNVGKSPALEDEETQRVIWEWLKRNVLVR
ncbi:NAD(P)-binding protein [Exidia glandulosa HHB12029]|uniref:NAD(P)-binding protein n=1 Tax=Exidia glandulosa HHB12029 TaxID=1314781 RepID=A0A165ZPP4_EXIGL|nr:NAD(P)-binding protein [Exidia glandulosa HHB12029]